MQVDGKNKNASIPTDIDDFNLDWAIKLLDLPRIIGAHPETGKEIEAAIGRYGPYLRHDGKYAKLTSTLDVFETGMNQAVVLLAEAANRKGGGRTKAEPIKTLGEHPTSGGEMKVMPGRYGPYVTDGTTNATIPKDVKPEDVTAIIIHTTEGRYDVDTNHVENQNRNFSGVVNYFRTNTRNV